MKIDTTHAVFFSPTGTSRAITRAVSGAMGEIIELDTTRKKPDSTTFSDQDLVVVGMPVYGGRLPQIAVERFRVLAGKETPVVALVIYGNRAYEDALIELCDLCLAQGFKVVAAAAFVGQHSFSTEQRPLAAGQPTRKEIHFAEQLGQEVHELLKAKCFLDIETIPGQRPYKPALPPKDAATATTPEECIQCGTCASSCPVQRIDIIEGMPQTWQDGCIWCMACIQNCPVGARKVIHPNIHKLAQQLYKNSQPPRKPQQFLPSQQ